MVEQLTPNNDLLFYSWFDFVFREAVNKSFESIVLEMCDLIGIVINNVVVVCVRVCVCVCDFLFVMKVCYLVS